MLPDGVEVLNVPCCPVTLTGSSEGKDVTVYVHGDGVRPLEVTTADGSRVSIKAGKSKTFVGRRDNRFHLLDCVCEICEKDRATAKGQDP